MGFLRNFRAVFHDDWCRECKSVMEEERRQLYAMPMIVGHYVSHKDPEYYKQNLTPVNRKADIPSGQYACGIVAYRCPECLYKAVKVSVFLPVRDMEKYEDVFLFENGEMDSLIK